MIYFIRDRTSSAVKIGLTDDVVKRLASLQTGNPNVLVLMGTIPGDVRKEMSLHRRFKVHHIRGEWFHIDPDLLSAVVEMIARDGDTVPPRPAPFAPKPVVRFTVPAPVVNSERFAVGDRVCHPEYGSGTASQDMGDGKMQITFDVGGSKVFRTSQSPLVKRN